MVSKYMCMVLSHKVKWKVGSNSGEAVLGGGATKAFVVLLQSKESKLGRSHGRKVG